MAADYYKTLGVEKTATADEIKQAYRKLSKEWHPDKHKGEKGAEKKFQEINVAYEVLSDEQKRRNYDQFGAAGAGGGQGGFDFSGFNGNMGDMGGFADIFENFFGGGARGRGPREPQSGRDVETTVEIDLADVLKDTQKTLRFDTYVGCKDCVGEGVAAGSKFIRCEECSGTGQVVRTSNSFFGTIQQAAVCPKCRGAGQIPEKACPGCKGEGRVTERVEVNVNVPAGIADGQTLRIRSRGEAGQRGAASGDLFVHVQVRRHERFERDDSHLRMRLEVDLLDALLGATVPVPTLDGSVNINVPAGTQPGEQLRVKGQGLPVLSSSRRGDLYATVDVKIPKSLSRKEKQLVEDWKKLRA